MEKYGGGLWRTWFDRGLSLAGLVTYRKGSEIKHTLVDCDRKPLLCIPNLAIHLTPADKRDIDVNTEEHLQPIFTTEQKEKQNNGAGKNLAFKENLKNVLFFRVEEVRSSC